MNRDVLKYKISFIVFVIISLPFFLFCMEPNKKVLKEDNYRKNSNWEEIEENFSEIEIVYKVENIRDFRIITELKFFAKDKDGKNRFLGSFSKTNGFINSRGEEFVLDPNLQKDSSFFNQKLLGLSMNCLEKPFSIKGMALSSENKIYETETMCRLYINCQDFSIEEWFPEI